MLVERLHKAWRDRDPAGGIRDDLGFSSEGLMLGADTLLAKADDFGPPSSFEDREIRLEALLCVAHGGRVPRQALIT